MYNGLHDCARLVLNTRTNTQIRGFTHTPRAVQISLSLRLRVILTLLHKPPSKIILIRLMRTSRLKQLRRDRRRLQLTLRVFNLNTQCAP